jgi:hypothetical protein
VPKKQRGAAQAALNLGIMPWAIFGALTGESSGFTELVGMGDEHG